MTPEIQIVENIELPDEPSHKKFLMDKAAQYQERINGKRESHQFFAPEALYDIIVNSQTYYALHLLGDLLKTGEVNVMKTRGRLIRTLGKGFNHDRFDSACGVVAAYSRDKAMLQRSLVK